MPRLAADQWAEIKQRREAGESFGSLAKAFDIDHSAIVRRAKKEGWGDGIDVGAAVRRKVTEKVTGFIPGCDFTDKAQAINHAAEKGAEVIARHQQDWEAHRAFFGSVADDFDAARHAKMNAEALRIMQDGERKAYNLEPQMGDLTRLDEEQLLALAKGKVPS